MKLKPLIARRLHVSREAVKAACPWRGRPSISELRRSLIKLGVAPAQLIAERGCVIMLSSAHQRGQLFQAA